MDLLKKAKPHLPTWIGFAAFALVVLGVLSVVFLSRMEGVGNTTTTAQTPATAPASDEVPTPQTTMSSATNLGVALENKQDIQPLHILARNPSVGDDANDNDEDIWDGVGSLPAFLPVSERQHIRTDDVEAFGLSILVKGVDENYVALQEVVTLLGDTTAGAVTQQAYSAINHLQVVAESASTVVPVNTYRVTCVSMVTATLTAVISPQFSASLNSQYFVPAGKAILLQMASFNINLAVKSDDSTTAETKAMGTFVLWVEDSETRGRRPLVIEGLSKAAENVLTHNFTTPVRIPPKSRIYASCWATVGVMDVTASIQAIIVDSE